MDPRPYTVKGGDFRMMPLRSSGRDLVVEFEHIYPQIREYRQDKEKKDEGK